ncbi:hypothetical protein PN466_22770 [Roseofilum reptotaenium CS-1145]|nr:hypothetical protein [Roseofilum reptotaenium]MDB9519771.1 hypothetical protein [Roseofilum reptotaenium CS-1145]
MITPEEMITKFFHVWETNSDNIFTTSGAIAGLDKLEQMMPQLRSQPNDVLMEQLMAWCSDYPQLSEKIWETPPRKLSSENNEPPPDAEDNSIANRFPKTSEVLQERSRNNEQLTMNNPEQEP